MNEVTEFVAALHLASKALQFYSAEHPRGVESLTQLEKNANALIGKHARVAVTASKGALLLDGEPIPHQTAHMKSLAQTFEERMIGGIILTQGIAYRELVAVVKMLNLRPQQIKDAGGAEAILHQAEVMHVRISRVRYEAITEGEEVVWSKALRRAEESGEANPAADAARLVAKLVASLTDGDTAIDPAAASDALKKALSELEPAMQLALMIGIDRMPEGEARTALQGAAREIGGYGGKFQMGGSESGESNPLFSVIASLTPEAHNADVIQARLAELGMSREELDEVLGVIAWERLPPAEKLQKILTGNAIFDIPIDKLLVFIRELLMNQQFDDVSTLVERYSKGTEHESYFIRQTVCDTFAQMAMFIKEPGVNPHIEQLLTRTILNTFVREPDARMRTTLGEAVANLATSLIATGRSEVALRALTRLETAVSVAPKEAAVHQAYESLWQALGDARRAGSIIEQVCGVDNETLSKVVIPLVMHTGTAIAAHLIEALGNEEDRNRRGRLVRALKAIGKPAHPFLIEALHSPTWFVVRNTLNVLSDIGERDHVAAIGTRLQHGDARVRRAAARALGRIGGAEAETLLAGAIYDRDAETQNEVFLCLASMKAVSAIPALIDVAKARRVGGGDEKAREAAIHTIAQIGSPEAIPGLVEIIRPKGIFARESLQVRVAAAKALSAINTPEAHQALQHAIATENDRNARETFAKLLPQT